MTQTLNFSPQYYTRVCERAGIPEVYCDISLLKIEQDGRAKTLWEEITKRATQWNGLETERRGLLISGAQGTGKSLALWMLARSAIKSYLSSSFDGNERAIITIPIVCKRFKHWLRDEFCPNEEERRSWNFGLRHDWLEARAIFLDDLTLDVNHATFRPVAEFLDLLIDDLSVMRDPPKIFITTNNTSRELAEQLGSQLIDRLAGNSKGLCDIVKCDWRSYR